MTLMALVGAAIGALLASLAWHAGSRRPSALVQLGRFDAHRDRQAAVPSVPVAGAGDPHGWQLRLGVVLGQVLTARGIAYTSLRQDLALTGGSLEAALVRKLLAGVAGAVLVAATGLALVLTAGLHPPAAAVTLAAVTVGLGFGFLPDVEARREAAGRRREFRRALAAYLDLVALEMAGSAAPAEALPHAARVGAGWTMALIRETLWHASLSGTDHWQALTDLGARIGVPELSDLGALVRLVGRDGARIRQTLTARAATMRRRELADAEGEAGEKDQSMRLAQILIGFGFITFLTYPAVVNVLAF